MREIEPFALDERALRPASLSAGKTCYRRQASLSAGQNVGRPVKCSCNTGFPTSM